MVPDRAAAVATELSIGAKVGGATTVVALVSLAHAMSHAYGALLPLIIPSLQTDIADRTSMEMLFGLYFTVGAIISAPWAWLLGMIVDNYGFPGAFAAMAGSQVLAGLCVLPVRLQRTWRTAH
jgi:sugar phosphate permease